MRRRSIMHTYNSTIDPLDKEIDFTHMKIEKAPYKFDLLFMLVV